MSNFNTTFIQGPTTPPNNTEPYLNQPDVLSLILQKLTARELLMARGVSKQFKTKVEAILNSITKQFLDELNILQDNMVISKDLFGVISKDLLPEITKDTFLKSLNPIKFETFLNSLTQFREIATKINTQIETQQDTNPKIKRTLLNNFKNKFLESLILNPNIIETINLTKIGFQKTYVFYYLGEIENEKANGHGILTDANGDIYIGHWENGLKHGHGTCTYKSGNRYVGNWENGQQHGQGTFTWSNGDKYEGYFIKGMRHGYGTFLWSEGDKYEGYFIKGMRHGQGTLRDRNGNVMYEGEWRRSKRDGLGKETFKNGNKYEGYFIKGMSHGQGIFTWLNGAKYEGEWVDGKKHGQGTLSDKNGNIYTGGWQFGKEHGQGILTYANGNTYNVKFKNGKKCSEEFVNNNKYGGTWIYGWAIQDRKYNGRGTLSDRDGNVIYTGECLNGKCHGQGIFTWLNGAKYEGEWVDGKKHGQGTLSDKNGNIYTGGWQFGKEHGQGTLTYANGNTYNVKFENGKKCSEEFVNNNKYGGTWIYGWAMYNLQNIATVIVLLVAISIGLNSYLNEKNQ